MDDTVDNLDQIKSRSSTQGMPFFGIFGLFTVNAHTYVIAIKNASLVGDILKAPVYRVEQLEFIPLYSNSTSIAPEDQQYIDMLMNL